MAILFAETPPQLLCCIINCAVLMKSLPIETISPSDAICGGGVGVKTRPGSSRCTHLEFNIGQQTARHQNQKNNDIEGVVQRSHGKFQAVPFQPGCYKFLSSGEKLIFRMTPSLGASMAPEVPRGLRSPSERVRGTLVGQGPDAREAEVKCGSSSADLDNVNWDGDRSLSIRMGKLLSPAMSQTDGRYDRLQTGYSFRSFNPAAMLRWYSFYWHVVS